MRSSSSTVELREICRHGFYMDRKTEREYVTVARSALDADDLVSVHDEFLKAIGYSNAPPLALEVIAVKESRDLVNDEQGLLRVCMGPESTLCTNTMAARSFFTCSCTPGKPSSSI